MPDTPQVGYEPCVVDLVVQQGMRWQQDFFLYEVYKGEGHPDNVPFDATEYNVRMEVRNRPLASMEGQVLITSLQDELGNGKFTWVNRSIGHLRAVLAKVETAAIPIVSERVNPPFPVTANYYYDIELFKQDGSFEQPIFRGLFKVKGEITIA